MALGSTGPKPIRLAADHAQSNGDVRRLIRVEPARSPDPLPALSNAEVCVHPIQSLKPTRSKDPGGLALGRDPDPSGEDIDRHGVERSRVDSLHERRMTGVDRLSNVTP